MVSSVAEAVELCLFDDDGTETRVPPCPSGPATSGTASSPTSQPGQRYGYRVQGPWDPGAGLRCNPAKLLLDPYAKAIEGEVAWDEAVFGHRWADPDERNDDDSAPFVPRSVVINPFFDWDGDRQLRTPWADTVIYEVHVKGATIRHPDIPEDLRGTYAGLAHPAFVEHLQRLGDHRRRAAAGPPVRPRRPPRRARAAQLLGLQLDRLPRPPQRVRRGGSRRAGAGASATW